MTQKKFQKTVYDFYKQNRRDLPWRRSVSPYKVLVSEIMLQQTQAPRVIPKFKSFIKKFPSFKALANAQTKDVLLEWQGLGYNRRAINLKRTAEIVSRDFNGKLPQEKEKLVALPGIGPYTAGAIRAFAWNLPNVFIETNIRSVYLHHFFNDGSCREIDDKKILPIVEKTLDTKNPREWYSALMDYGTHLKATLPNPSRRSKHHAKQSTFKGSNRELRSHILKAILEKPQTLVMLTKTLEKPKEAIKKNLESMQKEGLLKKSGSRYTVS